MDDDDDDDDEGVVGAPTGHEAMCSNGGAVDDPRRPPTARAGKGAAGGEPRPALCPRSVLGGHRRSPRRGPEGEARERAQWLQGAVCLFLFLLPLVLIRTPDPWF
ncbi:hypothetical protein GW17_00016766 [Ensete ventricosum]|nr:hypothetical protein GW17_00016766 [Ensete ventricosum]